MSAANKIITRIQRSKTLGLRELKGVLGLNEPFFRKARGARILVYHGICLNRPTRFNSLFITAKAFESHLRFYKKYFQVISMDDFYRKKFNPDRFNVCLTFDDGYANNLHYAVPLLEKFQLPAHFFVTAIRAAGQSILWNDFLCQQQHFGPPSFSLDGLNYRRNRQWKYERASGNQLLADDLRRSDYAAKARMMQKLTAYYDPASRPAVADFWMQLTGRELQAMAHRPRITIGSHGYYHNDLAMLSPAALFDELKQSKAWLETITGRAIASVAFPYGSYSPAVLEAAQAAGYDQLLGVDFNRTEDLQQPLLRERFTVNPYISLSNQMIAIVKNKYA